MNRVFTSSGWFAVEAIGHACSLGPQPASTDNPVWQVVGAMVLLISVVAVRQMDSLPASRSRMKRFHKPFNTEVRRHLHVSVMSQYFKEIVMSRKVEISDAAMIKSEHASLNREIADWRRWWDELNEMGQQHFGEMGGRLAQFRTHLVTHINHEESLLSEAPAEIAKALPRQREAHAQLLSELDQLIERLRARESDFECWGAARSDFEQFLDCLQSHEADEEQLLELTR